MDVLEAQFPARSVIPDTPKQRLVSAILEMWGDEWLLIPAMHYRWNHDNFPFIYEEFGKIALPSMPALLHTLGGFDYMQTSISHRVARENNMLVADHR